MVTITLLPEFFQLLAIFFGAVIFFGAASGLVMVLMALKKFIDQRRSKP